MKERLLVVIPAYIPTAEIIIRTLKKISSLCEIKIVTHSQLKIHDLLSGKYKLLFLRLCDPVYSYYHLLLINHFKIKYIYYLDDNFWELKGDTPISKFYQDPSTLNSLNGYVRNAYLVIAGSEPLAAYVSYYNKNVTYINAAFDNSILKDVSQDINSTKKIKILYSASKYRDQDFQVIIKAIKKISYEYLNSVTFYFYGYVPQELKILKNCIFDENIYPYEEYITRQFQENFDIGLAPLANTLSSRAKTNLKYREYGACRIAGIYANMSPYSDCIVQGKNGLLVNPTTEEWYEAITSLINSKELRKVIVDNACFDVLQNYSHEKIAPQWEAYIVRLPYNEKLIYSQFIFSLHRIIWLKHILKNKIKRIIYYYEYHGMIRTSKKIIRSLLFFIK